MCSPANHWGCFLLALRRYQLTNALKELHYMFIEIERGEGNEQDYASAINGKNLAAREAAFKAASKKQRD